ncbi:MAG: hypothetical protein PHO65_04730 [Sulfurovum sp.]|nr:hypothetical protein [Sulfurovum sp.]
MKHHLNAEIETPNRRREWIKEDITTFDQKKALVLKAIYDIIGRQVDGSNAFEIRNEAELGAVQAVLVYFYSFHQVIYKDTGSDRSIDREYERYEELQKNLYRTSQAYGGKKRRAFTRNPH